VGAPSKGEELGLAAESFDVVIRLSLGSFFGKELADLGSV